MNDANFRLAFYKAQTLGMRLMILGLGFLWCLEQFLISSQFVISKEG